MPVSSLRRSFFLSCLIFLALTFPGCHSSDSAYVAPDDALFTSLSADDTGLDFLNTVTEGEEYNLLSYRNFYNGGGVAVADLNGDGLNDLYFTANQGPNVLYLNRGDWEFERVEAGGRRCNGLEYRR